MEITRKGPPLIRIVPEEYPSDINELLSLLAPFILGLKKQLKDEVKAEVLRELTGMVKISEPAIVSDWHLGPIVDEVPTAQPVVLPGIVPIQIPEPTPEVTPPAPEPVIEVIPEPVEVIPEPEPVVEVPEPVEETTDPEPPPAPWTQPGDPPPPEPVPEPTKPKRGRKPKKVKAPKPPKKGGRPATFKSDTESTWYKCRKSWAQANLLQKKRGLPPIPKAEFEAAYYLKHPPETGQMPKTEPVVPAPLEDG